MEGVLWEIHIGLRPLACGRQSSSSGDYMSNTFVHEPTDTMYISGVSGTGFKRSWFWRTKVKCIDVGIII
jgi:hypothetical protein